MGVLEQRCRDIRWRSGWVEVDWGFCALWDGFLEDAEGNHKGARGRVEGYSNCELSERFDK
jgi:hypothetical protein